MTLTYSDREVADDRRPETERLADPRVRVGQDFTAGEEN